MKLKICLTFFYACLFYTTHASDTTHTKKRFSISLSVGYLHNSVYGSGIAHTREFNDGKTTVKNKGGFAADIIFENNISSKAYIHWGLIYSERKVYPQENTGIFYKDHFNTSYLSLPFLVGIEFLPNTSAFNIGVEAGPDLNIKISDKSYYGPDRANDKASTVSLSLSPGANLNYKLSPHLKALFKYTFFYNLTNSYVESLYFGAPQEPIRDIEYKYKTSSFAIGINWDLK